MQYLSIHFIKIQMPLNERSVPTPEKEKENLPERSTNVNTANAETLQCLTSLQYFLTVSMFDSTDQCLQHSISSLCQCSTALIRHHRYPRKCLPAECNTIHCRHMPVQDTHKPCKLTQWTYLPFHTRALQNQAPMQKSTTMNMQAWVHLFPLPPNVD